jgi:hypothetical protein
MKSDEGKLVVALIIASKTFAEILKNNGSPEAIDLAAALLVGLLVFLLVLITETKALDVIASNVQQCTYSDREIASLTRH